MKNVLIIIPIILLFSMRVLMAQHCFTDGECRTYDCISTNEPDPFSIDFFQNCYNVLNDSVFIEKLDNSTDSYFHDTFKVVDETWYRLEQGTYYLYFSKVLFDRGDSIKHIALGCDTISAEDSLYIHWELMLTPLGRSRETYKLKAHLISEELVGVETYIIYFSAQSGLLKREVEGDIWELRKI